MEITNKTNKALHSYFQILSKQGYKNYKEVYKLIVLCFLEELINSQYSFMLKDEDYRIIMNYIKCINESC